METRNRDVLDYDELEDDDLTYDDQPMRYGAEESFRGGEPGDPMGLPPVTSPAVGVDESMIGCTHPDGPGVGGD